MIQGNIFKNWNKLCYIAAKVGTKISPYGNEINVYEKPKKYKFNIQPVNGQTDVQVYGERVEKMYKAIIPMKYKDIIKEGDIVYLEGATPEQEEEGTYGTNGNYVVDSVRPQNLALAIYFEKIQK